MSEWFDDNDFLDQAFQEPQPEPEKKESDQASVQDTEQASDQADDDIDFEGISEDADSQAGNAVVPDPESLEDHERAMWDTIDKFEERAWSSNIAGIKTGWSALDRAFDGGLQTGWVLIGGDSNIGKSGFISQLAWQISQANGDRAYVLDFSLDDPMHDKLPRVVGSMNKVLINAVRNPNNFTQYPKMLERREQGMKQLRSMVDRYRAFDSSVTTDIDKIEEIVREHAIYLDEQQIDRKLVVCIDNFHDLSTTAKEASGGDKQKFDYLAQRVSDLATKFDIAVITSGEFKKLNGFRRPQVDDIRESVKIKYEAKAILLCYNEVSLKGEAAGIYFERQGEAAKQPVFEVKFGKNKFSSFKGRLFYEFYPEMAFFEESDDETSQQYNNAIYAND